MKKKSQPKRIDKIREIDETFDKKKYNQIMIISYLATFVVGVIFQLTDNPNGKGPILAQIAKFGTSIFWPPLILIPVAFCFYIVPEIILAIKRDKYESKKLEEVSTYIEQMLYSFKKNSKILSSLIDTLEIFPEGKMKDTIELAIEHIRTGQTTGNIYREALNIIEKEYGCRRIRSLHRFLVKVEGVGGEFEMGVNALLNDRRLWIERLDDYKKQKSAIIKDIIVSTIFSTVIILATLYMLPSTYPVATNIVLRVCAVIYMLVSMLNIKGVFKKTILYVNDIEDKEHEKSMAEKLYKYRHYDVKKEKAKAGKAALILLGAGVVGAVGMILMGNTGMLKPLIAMCTIGASFAYFIQPKMIYNNMKKSLVSEVEKVYPDWLLELSLLLQTKNLHVALDETSKTAPLIIRKELKNLAKKIALDPTNVEPYGEFLQDLPVPSIHSSMKLLYSIGEYGSTEEANQIKELLKRNAALMNKAEIKKNEERLSKVFLLKFIPMGASAIKMIIDMFMFLVVFMGSAV